MDARNMMAQQQTSSASGKRITLVLAALLVLLASPVARAVNWHWALNPERYKKMNTFERAQYDKAAHLLETNQPAAAASEFEKFKVQFGDSPVLSYALFMRAYCLHQSKHRNDAIKAYHEVVDFFADQVDDASAALYFEGVAHFENGDTSKGIRCMKQLADSPLYKKCQLTAGALRRLADAYWQQKNPELAVQYWRQVVTDFGRANDEENTAALSNLTAWYIIQRDYVSYENLMLADDAAKQDPAAHRRVADIVYNRAHLMYWNGINIAGLDRLKPLNEKELAAEQKAAYDYFSASKPWWLKASEPNVKPDPMGFYSRSLSAMVYWHKDNAERDKVLTEALAYLKTLKDKEAADGQIAGLCDLMRQGQSLDRARVCVAALTDRTLAAWKEHECLGQENKWKEALLVLDQVEASTVGNWAARALVQKAGIYDRLGEFQKSITLYEKVNDPPPPWPQWRIQEVYWRWKKPDMAIKTLTEIENLFPDHSARAIWQKATYYNALADKKRAMAQCHRLLKLFPKASEVPAAHAMLVTYGELNFAGKAEDDK
jgi:tetratricopeptide (TPR) repeat protein